jgi:hypothetical protein
MPKEHARISKVMQKRKTYKELESYEGQAYNTLINVDTEK